MVAKGPACLFLYMSLLPCPCIPYRSHFPYQVPRLCVSVMGYSSCPHARHDGKDTDLQLPPPFPHPSYTGIPYFSKIHGYQNACMYVYMRAWVCVCVRLCPDALDNDKIHDLGHEEIKSSYSRPLYLSYFFLGKEKAWWKLRSASCHTRTPMLCYSCG